MSAEPAEKVSYSPALIEKKWQDAWENSGVFKSQTPSTTNHQPPTKYYVLEMFPYPSGRIHMGHLRNYAIGDVVARFKRAQGFDVLHPMGWDAFGLPAENAAIKSNTHPAKWTYKNIENMREQLKPIGFSYDWEREIATCDVEYYRHEQKIFLDFLKNGLAYRKEAEVNWDPVDHTVLANEQVIDGRGWRSGALVERKKLNQWFLKITDFADDLLEGLKTLKDWPERVISMQEKWIGKSSGAKILFEVEGRKEPLEVFTTRPDTIFGASFCAISAGHPLAMELAENNPQIAEFMKECAQLGTSTEAIEKAEKKGVDTGLKIKHPFMDGHKLPLYIANFVLMEYGTGAIFACPAHDQRDLDFARKYNLPVIPVVAADGNADFKVADEAYTGDGKMINSDFVNGLSSDAARERVISELERKNIGERRINYRLRDWGISRQRYWGCPIPIIYCDKCGVVPVPERDLPVELPPDVSFDKPGNPLDHHPTWKHVNCPSCTSPARRETDTFDTFFESSWYFARFCSPKSKDAFDKKEAGRMLPVDQYIGGIEHAVLHLLYARFFTRALKKCGYLNVEEPFKRLLTQGMVCHITFKNESDTWLYPEEVERQKDGSYIETKTGKKVAVGRIEKMSKSKNNVVDPDEIVSKYGADTARLFMLSDSPPERDLEWSDMGVEGAYRYLKRLWDISAPEYFISNKSIGLVDVSGKALDAKRVIHKTIDAVTSDLENFHFNKAIARVRELTNLLEKLPINHQPSTINLVYQEGVLAAIKLLNPMIPHITEEIWARLGNKTMLVMEPWPVAIKELLLDDKVMVAVQVNGKLRGTIELPKDAPEELAKETALALESTVSAIAGKQVKKIIVVPNRIVNVVAT